MAANWLNANASRQYPFVPAEEQTMLLNGVDPVALPESVVLDFGCIINPGAGFVDGSDLVYLSLISRVGNVFTFEFTQTAAETSDEKLTFSRLAGDNEFASEWAESLPPGEACDTEPIWTGFLVTGDLSELEALLSTDGYLAGGDHLQIEPARLQNVRQRRVNSISLANAPRNRVDQIYVAPGSSLSVDTENGYSVNSACLTGDVRLGLSFNCDIRQSVRTNTLTITSRVGAGAGEPCDEFPLYSSEPMPDGFTYTGGPRCKDVVGWLNGIKGPVVRIVGGRGISVYPDPLEDHTLVIDADMHDLVNCQPPVEGTFGGQDG